MSATTTTASSIANGDRTARDAGTIKANMMKPTLDRRLIEALKLSPYVSVTFEFGDKPTMIKVTDKLFSHDVGIAVQSYILRKQKRK